MKVMVVGNPEGTGWGGSGGTRRGAGRGQEVPRAGRGQEVPREMEMDAPADVAKAEKPPTSEKGRDCREGAREQLEG